MDVRIIECEVAVFAFAYPICQITQRQNIDFLIQKNALIERDAFSRVDFAGNEIELFLFVLIQIHQTDC